MGAFVHGAEGVGGGLALLVEAWEDFAGAVLVVEEGEGGEGLGAGGAGEQLLHVAVRLSPADSAAADGFHAGGFDGLAAEAGDDSACDFLREVVVLARVNASSR